MTNKKHGYDWDAMGFDPDEDVYEAFTWYKTPQGEEWWGNNDNTPEGQAEFALMKRLYAEDMAVKAGPVRTVTRKEVVPGVYGKVKVGYVFPDQGIVYLGITPCEDDNSKVYGLSRDELTVAIETLTQIRDALEA